MLALTPAVIRLVAHKRLHDLRLLAFVWLGAAVSVFCGICAAAVGVAARSPGSPGEVEGELNAHPHAPADR